MITLILYFLITVLLNIFLVARVKRRSDLALRQALQPPLAIRDILFYIYILHNKFRVGSTMK